MHRLDSEFGKEPKGEQVQIAVDKAVEPEFGSAVLACLMMYHLFTDFLESGVLCQVGDITVHFTVHFDVFYYIFAICFQSAVKIVQVFDARDFTCGGVE